MRSKVLERAQTKHQTLGVNSEGYSLCEHHIMWSLLKMFFLLMSPLHELTHFVLSSQWIYVDMGLKTSQQFFKLSWNCGTISCSSMEEEEPFIHSDDMPSCRVCHLLRSLSEPLSGKPYAALPVCGVLWDGQHVICHAISLSCVLT